MNGNVENKKDEAEADFIFWLVVMAHESFYPVPGRYNLFLKDCFSIIPF